MSVGRFGTVGVKKVRFQFPCKPGHAPGIKCVKSEMPIGVIRPEKMNRHAFDFTIEIRCRLVRLCDDLDVKSRPLLRDGVVENPSPRMHGSGELRLRVIQWNRDVSEVNDAHGAAFPLNVHFLQAGSIRYCFR